MKKIAISAGEHSGDLLGMSLIEAINAQESVDFFGLAGSKMQSVGCRKCWDISQVSVMGFVEVLKKLPSLLRLRREMIARFKAEKPDLFIGIDAPDFNFKIEAKLRQAGIKTAHFISPSVWAWRASRIKKIKQSTDLMLCVFPFEVEFYRQHNMSAIFVGHPLAHQLLPRENYQKTGKILLMPGSRKTEISAILPPILQAIPDILANNLNAKFSLALLDDSLLDWIKPQLDGLGVEVEIIFNQSHTQLPQSDLVITASGTATLEAMIVGVPMVVVHKLPILTNAIARKLMTIDHIALPNILSKQYLVPELTQSQANPAEIAKHSNQLLSQNTDELVAKFKEITQTLVKDKTLVATELLGLIDG